jgi:hypothetical protein
MPVQVVGIPWIRVRESSVPKVSFGLPFLTSDNLAVPDLISLGCITTVFAQMVRPTKGF